MQTKPPQLLRSHTLRLGLAAAVALLASAAGAQAAEFEVTIYNASPQIFSPPVVVSHRSSVSVFEVSSAPEGDSEQDLLRRRGTVTISQGINRGSLRPFDWRNPVVKVTVERAN